MPWTKSVTHSVLALAALAVASCGNIPEPRDGRTMRTIYEQQMVDGSGRNEASHQPPTSADVPSRPAEDAVPPRYSAYTRSVRTEIDNLFPVLPNPTLFLYIRPHTVGNDQIPVPGYTVPVKMYERDQHAMPGEVVPAAADAWEQAEEDWGVAP